MFRNRLRAVGAALGVHPNQLEVKTFDANLSGLSDQVALTVNVP